MKIEILGTGCAKCDQLEELTRQAVAELAVQAEVVKVKELSKIMRYGVVLTPALVIDGEVKASGKVPAKAEITSFITSKLSE